VQEEPVDRPTRPSPDNRLTDEQLVELVAEVLAESPPTRADVVDAGRVAWLWRSVTGVVQNVSRHPGGAPDVSTAPPRPD
jgi:hypothetical protein